MLSLKLLIEETLPLALPPIALTSIVLEVPLLGFFFFDLRICWNFVANWFYRASWGSLLNMKSETARKFWCTWASRDFTWLS